MLDLVFIYGLLNSVPAAVLPFKIKRFPPDNKNVNLTLNNLLNP